MATAAARGRLMQQKQHLRLTWPTALQQQPVLAVQLTWMQPAPLLLQQQLPSRTAMAL
jgi:hypothetical protein